MKSRNELRKVEFPITVFARPKYGFGLMTMETGDVGYGYFHQWMVRENRTFALIEKEDGKMQTISYESVKFIS